MKTQIKTLHGLLRPSTVALFILGSCLAAFFFSEGNSQAAATAEKTPTATQAERSEKTKSFEYILENRADPFVPFITEKAATQETGDMNEIVETDEELTGMQVFEPAQLTLVALMEKEGEKVAMVQDFTGKGYAITEGTKIGKRGVVKSIVPNKVLIEEIAQTRAGKKIITHIDMVLKKEGEK